ncbi:MAG TPA: hypothetical protein VKF80_08065 [Candidatus Eisenbacteria bacterium]|nr:hypothetical protein [Candidatus Eisenbacteria bacterium]
MAKPSQSPASVDPETLVEEARRWARPLQDTLGSSFVSLYLYGSAVDGGFRPGKSDLNLLLVTRPLAASGLRGLAKAWPGDRAGAHHINLVLLSDDQIPRAHDAFSLELAEIRSRGRLVAGKDVLAGTETPREALRLHVERDLRVLGVRLRRVYLGAHGDTHALASTLAGAAGSLLACARGVLSLTGSDGGTPESALSRTAAWAGIEAKPWLEAWRMRREKELPDAVETMYVDFLDACDRLLAKIDDLDTTRTTSPSTHA